MTLQDDREFLSRNLLDAVVPSRKIINQTILMLKPNGIIKNLEAPYNEIKELFKKQFENSCFLDGSIITESVPEYNAFAPHINSLVFLINIALASYMLFSQTELDHVLNSLFTAVVPETTKIDNHICTAYSELLYLVAKSQIDNSNDNCEALLKSLKPSKPDRMAQYDERINQHESSCLESLSNGAPIKSQEEFILIWQKALVEIIKQSRPIRDILISIPKQLTIAVKKSKVKQASDNAQKINGGPSAITPTVDTSTSTSNGINTENMNAGGENSIEVREMDSNDDQMDPMNTGVASESQNGTENRKDDSVTMVDLSTADRNSFEERAEEGRELIVTRNTTEVISGEQANNDQSSENDNSINSEGTEQGNTENQSAAVGNDSSYGSSENTSEDSSGDSISDGVNNEDEACVTHDQSPLRKESANRARVEEVDEIDELEEMEEVEEVEEDEEDVFVDASQDFFEEDDDNSEEVFVDAPASPKSLSDPSTPLSRASTSPSATITNSPSSQTMPVPALHPSNEETIATPRITISPSSSPSTVMTPATPPAVQMSPPLPPPVQPQPQPQQPERKRTVAEIMASGESNPFMSNRNRYHTSLFEAGSQERKRRKKMW